MARSTSVGRGVKQVNGNGRGGGGGRVARLGLDDRLQLHDLTLERDVLGSFLLYPEIVLESQVCSDDFYSGQHEEIFSTILHLLADGEPVGTAEVRGVLHDRQRLEALGGWAYLDSLTDGLPSRTVDTKRLRRLARRRRVHEAAALVAARAGSEELPRYRAALDLAWAELEAVDRDASPVPALADCIAAIGRVGPRYSLSLPELDEATRGGVPVGKIVALVGAPGATKTNLATWLADGWERAGCAVAIVAADESRESIVTRLGQLDGFSRDGLEAEDDGRRGAFAHRARGRAISVIDPFEDGVSLEGAERVLDELAAGGGVVGGVEGVAARPRVLVVDSLQTVPCDAATMVETTREKIEAVVKVLKGIARRGVLVVVISEMSRAGYRTGKSDVDISALAAGAESRALEYAAHLLLGLKPVKGEIGIVDVETAKNRLGPGKPTLRVRLDFETLAFRQIERPDPDELEADREHAREGVLRTRILGAVARSAVPLRNVNEVMKAARCKTRDGSVVLRSLVTEGAIVRGEGGYRVALTGQGGAT